MSRLFTLPDETLKLVMQHVPLKDRLTSCCLVNREWHAAAVATTDLLLGEQQQDTPADHGVLIQTDQHARAVLQWLDHYGQHLTSLEMHPFPWPLRQLPCPNLQVLVLGPGCITLLKHVVEASSRWLSGRAPFLHQADAP